MKPSELKKNYTKKFAELNQNKLFQSLNQLQQEFIRETGEKYWLTFQELQQITEMAIDFNMWGEPFIEEQWKKFEGLHHSKNGNTGKAIFKDIRDYWLSLKTNPSIYEPETPKIKSIARKVKNNTSDNAVFGSCPVASEKTVCCNLHTIDAVQGCGLGCSYCSIQTFYEDGAIGIEKNLGEKLDRIVLDPKKYYHIGSGQSSDSLAMGNRNGILDAQLNFAGKNPNIILEFKTKTKNVDHFLSVDLPSNIFVCWSLNPQIIINHEEHFTASLEQRINAARQLADAGVVVGFHFHPIVYFYGWKEKYNEIVQILLTRFSPNEVGMISLGTLTFIKPAIKNLRELGMPSKVLQIPFVDAAGKYSYPFQIKEKLFKGIWNAFRPWHDKVFFYFCMEERKLWESVMGRSYDSNAEFEDALFSSISGKMKGLERVKI
ncbi:MAG: hypothetical protein HQ534_01785 [Armatimonadetes bacterium]|nr:hypothetical protein [Armatimonadota bacterium]